MTLPQRISLASSLLAIITIVVCYTVAVWNDSVPLCIPLLHGCTAITSTSVHYPEAFYFRGGLISAGVFVIVWWYCMHAYLSTIKPERWNRWLASLFTTSVFASTMLIVSVLVMGPHMADSKSHRLLWSVHTISAVLFFLITTINQVGVTWWLKQSLKEDDHKVATLPVKMAINVFQLMLLLWLFSNFYQELSREIVNIIEWWLALLACLYFMTSYWDWKEFRLAHGRNSRMDFGPAENDDCNQSSFGSESRHGGDTEPR